MKEPNPLPFLARPGYRRRRLIELIRLIPFVGLLFFLLPMLWATGRGDEISNTSNGWLYLFAVWFLLIAGAAALARRHDRAWEEEDREEK